MESQQHFLSHVKLVLCDSIRASTTREEAKLFGVFVSSELADAVVRPGGHVVCLSELDSDGCPCEVEETGSTVVAHHRLGRGWELWKRRRRRGREEERERERERQRQKKKKQKS